MTQQALTKITRPKNFSTGFVGQEITAKMISYGLESGTLGQAILLSGERGCGKTSSARIIARALNCVNAPTSTPCGVCEFCRDETMLITEIDGASNRGVEEVRNLKENIKYISNPNKNKVIIIDEVHMMTTEAFNALLKTLEEPPSNVVFILCTTEPEKLPATIISRTKHFTFSKIPVKLIQEHLKNILVQQGFTNYVDEGLMVIAEHANGGMRDAVKLLEQCLLLNNQLNPENIYKVIGTIDHTSYLEILKLISENNIQETLLKVRDIILQGIQPKYFYKNFISIITNVILKKVYTDKDNKIMQSINLSNDTLLRICDILQRDSKESFIELSIIKILQLDSIKSIYFNPNHEIKTERPSESVQEASEGSEKPSSEESQHSQTQTQNVQRTVHNNNKEVIHSALAYKVFLKENP